MAIARSVAKITRVTLSFWTRCRIPTRHGRPGPLCPRVDDYDIFFATQRLESKDTSGDKIIVRQPDGTLLRDDHGHYVVQHDFFNHEGRTHDGIAEAFAEFGAREELSFF